MTRLWGVDKVKNPRGGFSVMVAGNRPKQRGGARNIGIKPKTLEKFLNVAKLLNEEPSLALKDALERFKLTASTYYRLKEKYEKTA